jgi:hypothetical protein
MDSRAGRVLRPGSRNMVDDDEWKWIEEHATGDFHHIVLATTLPFLLAPGMHYLEAWDEAIAEGAWGGPGKRFGERLRQGLDMEHWAAFQESFHRVVKLVRELATGERGRPPGSIVFLSGDVHHAYLAEFGFPRDWDVKAPVWQAVCSPIRNPLDRHERLMLRFAGTRPFCWFSRALAKAAGVKDPGIRWRLVTKPTFDNQLSTLDWEGDRAHLKLEKAVPGDPKHPRLELSFDRRLA